jgi:hypothetical protein
MTKPSQDGDFGDWIAQVLQPNGEGFAADRFHARILVATASRAR